MDHNDKKETEKQQLDVLSQLSQNTPKIERHFNSSVFFTPPYSDEGPSRLALKTASPGLTSFNDKIPFDLSIGLEEFSEKVDMMKKLYESCMVSTVCNLIFKFLDEVSLLRASQVSRTWRDIIRNREIVARKRISDFISKQKENCILKGKENIGLQKRSRAYMNAQSIIENTPEYTNTKKFILNEGTTRSGKTWRKSSETYKQCVRCTSPARIDNERQIACCSICAEEFCLNCLNSSVNHNAKICMSSQSKRSPSSQKGKQRKHLSGTKESRNRLRRLTLLKK